MLQVGQKVQVTAGDNHFRYYGTVYHVSKDGTVCVKFIRVAKVTKTRSETFFFFNEKQLTAA